MKGLNNLSLKKSYNLFINNAWRESTKDKRIKAINPSNGVILAEVTDGSPEDVDIAVKSAKKAFEYSRWAKLTASERGKLLIKLAELIDKNKERLAKIETLNNGKPIRETIKELTFVIQCFEYFGGLADKIQGDTIPIGNNFINYTTKEPIGVVGQIIPWNSPMLMLSWKIAPCLAAGNTLILKPSEETSLTALEFANLCLEAEIPEGVINIVTGYGETAGKAIVCHEDINMISFTGSPDTGISIYKMAAKNLKRLSLELGGKSPNIVFDDADLDNAVNAALSAAFAGQGQSCAAGSRLFLHEKIKDRFLQEFIYRTKKIKIGDPLDIKTEMGPLTTKKQFEKVEAYTKIGILEGATLLIGGKRKEGEEFKNGLFFEPTVFDNVNCKMRIAQEEIFGPLVVVIKFSDFDEVVFQANDVIYGLTAAIWTNDIFKAHKFAEKMKAGTIWINGYKVLSPLSPYGGFKMSGFGKENGMEAIQSYTNTKSIWINLNKKIVNNYTVE